MTTVDLSFPLVATGPIPADHGYHRYGVTVGRLNEVNIKRSGRNR